MGRDKRFVVGTLDAQTITVGGNTIAGAEMAFVDGVTAGTVTANKAVVVDANKDAASLRNLTLTGNLVIGGNTMSATDLGYVDGITPGTVAASKAVVVDANLDIASFRNVTTTGTMTIGGVTTLKTATAGLVAGCGTSGAASALGTTAGNALSYYFSTTHTTGDMRGEYLKLTFSGAGGSGEAARIFSSINNVSVATGGTVNGAHISIGTAGASAAVSGAANALRATFGIAAASTNIGGTCSVIQVDTDFDTAVTVPTNFAFLRFTNTNTKKSNNLMRIPNVAAEAGGLFCAHDTQAMTHSIKIVSENGTPYYIMCTNASTNRTES